MPRLIAINKLNYEYFVETDDNEIIRCYDNEIIENNIKPSNLLNIIDDKFEDIDLFYFTNENIFDVVKFFKNRSETLRRAEILSKYYRDRLRNENDKKTIVKNILNDFHDLINNSNKEFEFDILEIKSSLLIDVGKINEN